MKLHFNSLVAALCLAVYGSVAAQDTRPPAPSSNNAAKPSKAERTSIWNQEKERLEKLLAVGKDKAGYRAELERAGYWITSINADSPSRLEYEIVKGANSYEVQFDLKDGRASKVDVTTNIWKAGATREALAGKTAKYAYPSSVTSDGSRFSDATRNRTWKDEKGRMEAELGTGHDRAHYRPALERLGYKVTSVNENDRSKMEFEVVRGDTSYEVQVAFDAATNKSTRVDVSTNMWETDATDRAKGEKK